MIRIHAERDSVCMGDDVTAPNADNFFFLFNKTIDNLLMTLCGYVPNYKNVVWEVTCNDQIVGYLFSDDTGKYQYESEGSYGVISELPSHRIFCRYHSDCDNHFGNGILDGATLLKLVKASKRSSTRKHKQHQ